MSLWRRTHFRGFLYAAALCLSVPAIASAQSEVWRIGLYQISSQAIPSEQIEWVFSTIEEQYSKKAGLDRQERTFMEGMMQSQEREQELSKRHEAWQSEDREDILTPEPERDTGIADAGVELPAQEVFVEFVRFPSDPTYDKLFSVCDGQFLALLGIRESLAELFVVWPEMIGDHSRLRIVSWDFVHQRQSLLLDRLIVRKDAEAFREEIRIGLAQAHADGDVAMLRIKDPVPGLSVRINGEDRGFVEEGLVLATGTYSIELSAFGYDAKTLTIELSSGEQTEISGQLARTGYGPLSIGSAMGTADWFLDGVFQGQLPSLVTDQRLPISIVANREGFLPFSLQSTSAIREITFDLKPRWMTDEHLIERRRDDFYASMARTLGAFGMWVGLRSAATTFGTGGTSDPAWKPWIHLSAGITIASVVDLVGGLLAYYTGTRYSTL